jgi:putative heme-binding domain-containing protein
MMPARSIVTLMMWLATVAVGQPAPQAPLDKNPFEGNPDAILAGMGGYRQRCADCHGTDGKGVRGPDITHVWTTGRTDPGLFKTIRSGVPGTEMPAFSAPRTSDREIWQMLAYLRTLATSVPPDPLRGDAENGAKLFRAHCASCHRVNAVGGRIGPDLSRIGSARSRDVLVLRIRRGSESFRPGYEPVTVTPESGPPIQGVKKNEDLFSVQIMDTRERIQGYEKDQVKSVVNGARSQMPVFGADRLSDAELDDLVRYLQTLRGFDPAVKF